ncbi:tRNA uridine-5-carboxymethylaminomethyl(34) synthesis GTPase MnmE [Ideonella azotifigens]|uniref:tRNA modification GTPase MnmE n=2 Tax=Ideonella azotifigens TaxID=513160 RepID=A0ABN1JQS6_9BURK|nr:tRNA uridine-5-carboxymethylaminomethyl(34) synthesis GTPase MnmE [Ideonella azotifigens]MCD2340201.1 tRNA uridine-5-carboxymethylaminomethyl(34) synthesis GTPase MnmE [Ideonella azotifigens]
MSSLGRHHDPIVAIATAPGRGAVGIVRASGKQLQPLVDALIGAPLKPRQAHYGPFRDATGQPIDHGLALFFPAPNSYTGEAVLELQAHGGPVVLQLLLARCLEAGAGIGLRLAEPGEFTERAFLNDKLDLAQAEAVADLIDASTEAAARSASRSLGGAFSAEVEQLAERIVNLRMLVEATLDFPEEEIDFLEKADARGKLAAIRAAVDAVTARARQGALLREGLRVVLAGQPNVGKSSLLNALAGAELAIVTPIAGTTRDRVSETIQIEGVPLHITDTAGLRDDAEAGDEVERIGMARSWESIHSADAIVFLHDLTRLADADYQAADARIAQRLATADPARLLQVFNKADTGVSAGSDGRLLISARTGAGLEALRQALLKRAGWQAAPEGVFIARSRHVQALKQTAEHLAGAAAHASQADQALDLFAEELRLAHLALQSITGRFSADDLLGEIFSRFCIGK